MNPGGCVVGPYVDSLEGVLEYRCSAGFEPGSSASVTLFGKLCRPAVGKVKN